jgi:excisionase family DNA binding protein
MNQYMTSAEVASLYRVDRRTVYRWIKAGKLHPTRAGRSNLFDREEVETFVSGHMRPEVQEIGRAMARAREIAGVSLEDAATAAGISTDRLREAEDGQADMRASVLVKLSDAYGCSMDTLIGSSTVNVG